jgi:uncharacterized membrane protein
MAESRTHYAWLEAISQRIREREVGRQLVYDRFRQKGRSGSTGITKWIPGIVLEFAHMIAGSLLGFWMISKLTGFMFHLRPVYLFVGFGILYSLQSTYYKYRLSRNPGYKIPRCKCARRTSDRSEVVLRSTESSVFGVPHSVFGCIYYCALFLLLFSGKREAAMLLSFAACAVSGFLSYVMVARIHSLCTNCINVGALNFLLLFELIR